MHTDKTSHLNGVVTGEPRARERDRSRDIEPAYREVARWLLDHEVRSSRVDQEGLAAAVERICQKFFDRLARVTSLVACLALLSRALHIPRIAYPFLAGVRAGTTAECLVDGLPASVATVDVEFARQGLEAVLGTLVDLLASFIGQNLTMRMLRDVWPELPMSASAEEVRPSAATDA